jgi:anti-sigma-K factor RskA
MNGHPIPAEDFDLYALGVLDGAEKRSLESHVASCADCARELDEARARMALLALSVPPQAPPAHVKQQLMQKIAAAPRQVSPKQSTRASQPAKSLASAPAPRWRSWSPVWLPVAAAFAVATIVLVIGNQRMNQQLQQLRDQVAQQSAQETQDRTLLNMIAASDTASIPLAHMPDMPAGQGHVFYNARMGMVLYNGSLGDPPPGKSYQLWLVPASGNPVSAGLIKPGGVDEGMFLMEAIPAGTQAKAFAVTMEPEGGMRQPTGPKVLVGAV